LNRSKSSQNISIEECKGKELLSGRTFETTDCQVGFEIPALSGGIFKVNN